LRRFNLPFALFDEERCEAIEIADESRNPFEDEQCVIADVAWLASDAKRAAQVAAADWDLVVVDEAHHLEWSPDHASAAYALVEGLAQRAPGLILLTATPQQLGRSGHFARLRLLDPARYTDLDAFVAESDGYARLSAIAERLLDTQPLDADDRAFLAQRFASDAELGDLLARYDDDRAQNASALIDALIDRHGTGRVMFRNRRAQIGGFRAASRASTCSTRIRSTTRNAKTCSPNSTPMPRRTHPRARSTMRTTRACPGSSRSSKSTPATSCC
jgi:ATP-dependent helicase HepA